MAQRPRVGISACLLGDRVRFDGGDKRDASLVDAIGPLVEWVRICPEAESGLGTPREPMRLVAAAGREGIAMVTIDTGRDVTATVRAWTLERIDALAAERICGFVLKSRSPSCGLDVPVFAGELPAASSRGLFADLLVQRFPDLPIEDEVHLADSDARAAFVARVFAVHRARYGEAAEARS